LNREARLQGQEEETSKFKNKTKNKNAPATTPLDNTHSRINKINKIQEWGGVEDTALGSDAGSWRICLTMPKFSHAFEQLASAVTSSRDARGSILRGWSE
jgi:hypothetical protein